MTITDNTKRFAVVAMLTLSVAASGLVGCSASRTKKGAAIGAATGAALGGIIGKQSDNTGKGAAIGAATGALVGGYIGHYMDKQAEELAKIEGAKTERVGDEIRVVWDSAILFDFDSAMLQERSKENLGRMADVFQDYPDTDIIVEGHTDSKGSETYNQTLSERRAESVRTYLVQMGVSGVRLATIGYGESEPVATNDTETGRGMNRRVEIQIRANEELRRRAEQAEANANR